MSEILLLAKTCLQKLEESQSRFLSEELKKILVNIKIQLQQDIIPTDAAIISEFKEFVNKYAQQSTWRKFTLTGGDSLIKHCQDFFQAATAIQVNAATQHNEKHWAQVKVPDEMLSHIFSFFKNEQKSLSTIASSCKKFRALVDRVRDQQLHFNNRKIEPSTTITTTYEKIFKPDGPYLHFLLGINASQPNQLHAIDPLTGQSVKRLTLEQQDDSIVEVAFTPTGESVLCLSKSNKVYLWDMVIDRRKEVHAKFVWGNIGNILSPNRQRLLAFNRKHWNWLAQLSWKCELFAQDIETGSTIYQLQEDALNYSKYQVTPDGRFIILYNGDTKNNCIIWKQASGALHKRITINRGATIDLNAEGILSMSGESIYMLTKVSNRKPIKIINNVEIFNIGSGSKYLIGRWNMSSGQHKQMFKDSDGYYGLCPSFDGNYLIAQKHTNLVVWDCRTGEKLAEIDLQNKASICKNFPISLFALPNNQFTLFYKNEQNNFCLYPINASKLEPSLKQQATPAPRPSMRL